MLKITSLQHPLVKRLTKLRKERKSRRESGTCVIHGNHMVREVCRREKAVILLVAEENFNEKIEAVEVFIVTKEIIKKISGVETPENILAEVNMPKESSLGKARFVVALDGISDPGNIGTLIRTALALGWEGAYILENSADPFNDKALRASKGAVFRLPLRQGNWEDLEDLIRKNELMPVAADLTGENVRTFPLQEKILLVLGNEAHGLSKEACDLCQKVTIPMPGVMESLNVAVAGGIIMYALRGENGAE